MNEETRNVICSCCKAIFSENKIVMKPITPKAVAENLSNLPAAKVVKKDDEVLGMYCPECGKLHAFGFREPIEFNGKQH